MKQSLVPTFYLIIALLVARPLQAQQEEPQVLETPTGTLYGSLIVPKGSRVFDLVVLQPGSGPTDRKGNNPLGVTAGSYWMLAQALAAHGIATLLIDKRGVAASKAAGKDESKLVFEDYIHDLEEWAQQLRKDKRVRRMILAGHSEGALIAMRAASRVTPDQYISICGPAQPIDEIITWQLQHQAPSLARPADSLFQRMRKSEPIDSIPPLLYTLFRPSIRPYMVSWMQYDPCQEIASIRVPTLIVQGTNDYQVSPTQADQLHRCRPGATLAVIEGMNHVLKRAPRELAGNQATYMDASLPVMPELVTALVQFIQGRDPATTRNRR